MMGSALTVSVDRLNGMDIHELRSMVERYPYFIAPAVALLRRYAEELPAEELASLRAMVVLNAYDADGLTHLTGVDGELFENFYPPMETTAATTTDDAISAFLETYGHTSPEEDKLLEQMIFNPVPDYGAVLQLEDDDAEGVDNSDDEASIDAFVKAFSTSADSPEPPQPEERKSPSPAPAEAPAESSLSESLAKIYIKQQRYDKAYEIIRHLCLNNPKKSVYFADQLRFLQKLMLNRSFSDD
ncbi:MAG: hypothetical protein NC098_07920 [Lachnoclostridium sp.]|nr:hypothetical protein [Lachnoclostridium sp.]